MGIVLEAFASRHALLQVARQLGWMQEEEYVSPMWWRKYMNNWIIFLVQICFYQEEGAGGIILTKAKIPPKNTLWGHWDYTTHTQLVRQHWRAVPTHASVKPESFSVTLPTSGSVKQINSLAIPLSFNLQAIQPCVEKFSWILTGLLGNMPRHHKSANSHYWVTVPGWSFLYVNLHLCTN